MKLCIIGSTNADKSIGPTYLTELLSVMLLGIDPASVQIGTFLNGPIHNTAASLALDFGCRLIRFHTLEAIVRWAPDTVMIFWSGQSVGCRACWDRLTRAGLFCQLYLVNPLARRLLGDNNQLRKQQPLDHPHTVEFATAEVC